MDLEQIRKKNLKEIMDEKRLTVSDLADLLDVKPNYIYALLAKPKKNYSRAIGNNTLIKLSEALEVPIERFHVGLGEPIIEDEFTSLIIDYLPRLHDEDKKTILRDVIRYLNPPEIASKVISDLFKELPGKK